MRRWRFQNPITLRLRLPIRRWTLAEHFAVMTDAEMDAWWNECPCGCDVPMDDDRYGPLHGEPAPSTSKED